jgi:hypothetical protein
VFVSFHHGNDQYYFELFTATFGESYDVFYDQSLDGHIRSDDREYVNRAIREDYIRGSSLTFVLCGRETWKRKYVHWEIYSTLHYGHALLAIILATAQKAYDGKVIVPDRLHANLVAGYAHLMNWPTDAANLKWNIEEAIRKGSQKSQIDNSLPRMQRNRS